MSDADARRFAAARAEFEALVDLLPAEREARLGELAERDGALAHDVAALLAADAGAGEFLAAPAGVVAREVVADWLGETAGAGVAGAQVGPYRLVSRLGRGGMGEVWEAERADGQFEQRVALKLLKRGMDSEEILRRFLRERQILAGLTHPGIARLLDGGLAADGRPYFALEKVDGRPITDHARERQLTVSDRLRLLIAVAEAVDAAHRQLVVHRDLKPSNILVTAAGEVRLLDFGIAKLLGEGDDATQLTALGQRALTPAYAAPEQILGETVTTATDVYALGVVLYELLSGKLPHSRSTTSATVLAAEVGRETTPRLVSAVRQPEASQIARLGLPPRELKRLDRRMAGDLETILARALAREPERRYASAIELAADLQRHLDGRPVRARPDSRLYRLRKFVTRHRVGVTAAALVLLSLAGGLSAALHQAGEARRERDRARAEAERARRVVQFLADVFAEADPDRGRAADLPSRELLARGAARVERDLADEPELAAELLHTIGNVDRQLGLHDRARPLLERALELRRAAFGEEHPDVAASLDALGWSAHVAGASAAARSDLEAALAMRERLLGPDHPDVARTLNGLANVYKVLGELDLARAAFVRAIVIVESAAPRDEALLARLENNYGLLLRSLSEPVAARAHLERALALHEAVSGPESGVVATTLDNLADLAASSGEPERALEMSRRALAINERVYGTEHPTIGLSLNTVGYTLRRLGRCAEARAPLERAHAVLTAAYGPSHRAIGFVERNLAACEADLGRREAAIAGYRRAIATWERALGPDNRDQMSALHNLGLLLLEQGAYREGRSAVERAIALRRRDPAPSAALGETLVLAARLARAAGDDVAARTALAEALALGEQFASPPGFLAEAREFAAVYGGGTGEKPQPPDASGGSKPLAKT